MNSTQRRAPKFTTALTFVLFSVALLAGLNNVQAKNEVLIADRLTNRILRYGENGEYLGTLVRDTNNTFSIPSSLVVSPDGAYLYVASRGNNRVIRYNYDGITATNPLVVTNIGLSTISQPAGLLFDGNTLLVANSANASSSVARFTPDGASAGTNLIGGPNTGRTGLAWGPSGDLLALNYAAGGNGGVLRFDTNQNLFVDLVAPTVQLRGAANFVVKGDDLYVAGSVAGTIGKFNARNGTNITEFNTNGYVTGLVFPASIVLEPQTGNSLLAGILGANNNGTGWIDQYSISGSNLGRWASATLVASNIATSPGFREATAMLVVPSLVSLDLVRTNGSLSLSWRGPGWTLQEASEVTGPWTNSLSQSSPVSLSPADVRKFFRLTR